MAAKLYVSCQLWRFEKNILPHGQSQTTHMQARLESRTYSISVIACNTNKTLSTLFLVKIFKTEISTFLQNTHKSFEFKRQYLTLNSKIRTHFGHLDDLNLLIRIFFSSKFPLIVAFCAIVEMKFNFLRNILRRERFTDIRIYLHCFEGFRIIPNHVINTFFIEKQVDRYSHFWQLFCTFSKYLCHWSLISWQINEYPICKIMYL